jgi:NADH-quinone oxidoreductase subunit E
MGRHLIKVCKGTACHVSGADILFSALSEELKVDEGGTTEDGLFTLESVACLGCCSLAPVVMIDGKVYGKLTPSKVRKIVKGYGDE